MKWYVLFIFIFILTTNEKPSQKKRNEIKGLQGRKIRVSAPFKFS